MRIPVVRNTARFVLLLGLAVSVSEAKDLTFAERVQAQETIERVYYAHQIGTTQPFEEAVPRALLEEKVREYLRQSMALEELWKSPVTAEMLARETERIATKTRLPERLRELYAALGNDAVLVQECLGRPALVDRLAHSFFAFDKRIHAEARLRANVLRDEIVAGAVDPKAEHPLRTIEVAHEKDERDRERAACAEADATWQDRIEAVADERDRFAIRVPLGDRRGDAVATYSIPKVAWDEWWNRNPDAFHESRFRSAAKATTALPAVTGRGGASAFSCAETWDDVAEDDVPDPRDGHTAVWTGSRLIVWGGYVAGDGAGGQYDPTTDTWTLISRIGAPSSRTGHTAIWTGSRMIVWGGYTNTGGQYDPVTDSWSATSTVGAPSARSSHTAVWTGSRMLVWGGVSPNEEVPAAGGSYDPVTDGWTPMSTVNAPEGREAHAAVWTGSKMVVWGGEFPLACHQPPDILDDGGQYDPVSDTWTSIARTAAAPPRSGHTAVWTGSEVLFWGGSQTNTGVRYIPGTNTWLPISTVNAPAGRSGHTAVWTGSGMIVWGGTDDRSGGRYDPSTNTWFATTTDNAPAGTHSHAAVWTGSRMLAWGGTSSDGRVLDTGGQYDPVEDTWIPTAIGTVPSPRSNHTAVWTGTKMLVWGGLTGATLRDGGLYDPALDTWTQMSTTGAPSARYDHTAVWTGSRMVVWGGRGDNAFLDTGGRYDPTADAWTSTSMTGAPSVRGGHRVVWTGSRMIVWGGQGPSQPFYLGSGGRYDPVADTWAPTSTSSAVGARYGHTAVWTGSRMVVWGGWGGANLNTGAEYDPETDTWASISASGAPSPRQAHSAVWTGDAMVVWGGLVSSYMNTGGRYDPASDTWTPTSTAGAPSGRTRHTAVWTGSRMVLWGGFNGLSDLNSGGQYDPALDTWAPTSTSNAPGGREAHTAVWTGSNMIVWGGGPSGGSWTPGGDLDGDARCDVSDNCPAAPNPMQEDADADGIGDACDCAPLDPANPVPGEALGLRPVDGQTFAWDLTANSYDVVRGDLALLPVGPGGGDEVCFADLATPMLTDSTVPTGGFFYLARGKSSCGSGPWGDARTGSGSGPLSRQTATCP